MRFDIILAIFYTFTTVKCDDETPAILEIPQGKMQGDFRESYGGRIYTAFEGIPYAKPPVGDLRFAQPQIPEKWDGILRANRTYSCLCYFFIPGLRGIKGSEDCLYVYVYVPLKKITGEENLDVVVHIHGGAFMIGAPSYMAGPNYLMDKDVVYVSFNYRLAIMGFLSTEDDVVSGNNGLKDQTMALRWIKENIKYFGGNPDSVTLTGMSAGSASVHLHYFSPLSRGLFHRGLSQSGTALQSWAIVEKPLEKAKTVANALACPTNSTETMVDCMRQKGANDVINAMRTLLLYFDSVPLIIFGPVIEHGKDPFLPDSPYKMLKEGNVYDVPWIASNVKDEGLFPSAFFVMNNLMGEIEAKWNDIMPYLLDLYDTVDESDLMDVLMKIKAFYYEGEPVSDDNLYTMVHLFNDRFFMIDGEKAMRMQAKANRSPVYYYFFTYLLRKPIIPTFGFKRGVSHGDDAGLYLKTFGSAPKLDPTDETMMKLFTEFIANYAKNSTPSINNVEWKPLEPNDEMLNVLKIESPDEIAMIEMNSLGKHDFWESLPIKENEKLYP
ncbi:unnamed protein product [Phyllotreta striolata]|uniref:Carboxylic ester hydrolase n=1 Tax=Phyllotreta striolata TaxID=444603 RepID=A0A9N9U0D0_PHYSR|nr:unnamed protein product [Phyllotreta striolata]